MLYQNQNDYCRRSWMSYTNSEMDQRYKISPISYPTKYNTANFSPDWETFQNPKAISSSKSISNSSIGSRFFQEPPREYCKESLRWDKNFEDENTVTIQKNHNNLLEMKMCDGENIFIISNIN